MDLTSQTAPASFDRHFYSLLNAVTRIGKGSLGGKALGLVSISPLLNDLFPLDPSRKISIRIPHMTVLATQCFDSFMDENRLYELDFGSMSDDRIAHRFQKAAIPANIVGDLRALAEEVKKPLAVRSSSLLEDSLRRPCAGVYLTKMIPNNDPSSDRRFQKLVEAVKFVFASMFFEKARRFTQSFNAETGDEKMAVIIQEVVGGAHGDRFYPTISGTARSYNFYPRGHANPRDGVVNLALGLGKTVVDGGRSFVYCPAYPKAPPPYSSLSMMMKETQTAFYAVHVGRPPAHDPINETEYLVQSGIDQAERDGTLEKIASTYIAENDRLVPGTFVDGPRVLDFAPILQLNYIPLSRTIQEVMRACEDALRTHVEIEFAVEIDRRTNRTAFNLLQVRPIPLSETSADLSVESLSKPEVIVASKKVLGNGVIDNIRDIVYVSADALCPMSGTAAAVELANINRVLAFARRPYMLIGYGRMGTSDPWRGVPAAWSQISFAKVIVEIQKKGSETELSQGSHFFHNMTSSETCYFSIFSEDMRAIDWDYITKQETLSKQGHVTHVRSASPLTVKVDGKSGRGIVTRHEVD
jgi:hypothetical protein